MGKKGLWAKHSTSLCGLPWRLPAAHPLQPLQLKASCAALKALSQAELPLQCSRFLSAHVPFGGDLFSQLISEWVCLWGQVGLLTAGGEKPASGSSYQPADQQTKGPSLPGPLMYLPTVCLSVPVSRANPTFMGSWLHFGAQETLCLWMP